MRPRDLDGERRARELVQSAVEALARRLGHRLPRGEIDRLSLRVPPGAGPEQVARALETAVRGVTVRPGSAGGAVPSTEGPGGGQSSSAGVGFSRGMERRDGEA